MFLLLPNPQDWLLTLGFDIVPLRAGEYKPECLVFDNRSFSL